MSMNVEPMRPTLRTAALDPTPISELTSGNGISDTSSSLCSMSECLSGSIFYTVWNSITSLLSSIWEWIMSWCSIADVVAVPATLISPSLENVLPEPSAQPEIVVVAEDAPTPAVVQSPEILEETAPVNPVEEEFSWIAAVRYVDHTIKGCIYRVTRESAEQFMRICTPEEIDRHVCAQIINEQTVVALTLMTLVEEVAPDGSIHSGQIRGGEGSQNFLGDERYEHNKHVVKNWLAQEVSS